MIMTVIVLITITITPTITSILSSFRVYLNGGNAKKALPVDVEADDLSDAIKVSSGRSRSRRKRL